MTDQQGNSDDLQSIFCLDKTCFPERDWVVMEIEPSVLLPLGIMCMAASITSVIFYYRKDNMMGKQNGIPLSVFILGMSICFRAAAGLKSNHEEALYVASMVFNYHAGQCIYSNIFSNSFGVHTAGKQSTKGRVSAAISSNQSLGLFAVTVCGAFLMFHPTTGSGAGINCFRVVLAIMLLMTFIMAGVFAYRSLMLCWHISQKCLVLSAAVLGMFLFWCCFMLARTFVGLDSPARSSLAMLIWFNYIPLCFCFIIATALGEPLLNFNDEEIHPVSACQDVELSGLECGRGMK